MLLFNLNEFLRAISFALDFVEMDILGVKSNHGKRTAYISLRLAEELNFGRGELHDLAAVAILHDNGISEKSLHEKIMAVNEPDKEHISRVSEHCLIGERNIREYPFLTDVVDVLKNHHERYDGNGLFHLKGDEVPFMSQLIFLSDVIEVNFNLSENNQQMREKILEFVKKYDGSMFSPEAAGAFYRAAEKADFWENLKNDKIDAALKNETPEYTMELSFAEIRSITGVFSRIIDSKSEYTQRHSNDLSEKAARMADFYHKSPEEKMMLQIAADLHDIGKLAVPNAILDSPRKLTSEEFEIVKKHVWYTRQALQEISGFEEITEWAANHHEKLNGSGYPFRKTADQLDFNSRLMACLDIYEALTEVRPYRVALSHQKAMEIMYQMVADGTIDGGITQDVDRLFVTDV